MVMMLRQNVLFPLLIVLILGVVLLLLVTYINKKSGEDQLFISENAKTLAERYCTDINNLDKNVCLLAISKVYSYLVNKYGDFNVIGRAIGFDSRRVSWVIGLYIETKEGKKIVQIDTKTMKIKDKKVD